jgi:nucleoside-diphosphate-sugar epimerase
MANDPPTGEITFTNRLTYHEALKGRYDAIVHLAPIPVDEVIECGLRSNARILYASSGAVYDLDADGYGLAKRRSEDLLLTSGLDIRIARLFSFVGKGLSPRLAPACFLRACREGRPMLVYGDGSVMRSYLYGADLGRWMWKILLDGEPCSVYDVGSDLPVSIIRLAVEIRRHFPHSPKIIFLAPRIEKRPYYIPHIERARADLGLEVWTPFEEAVEKYIKESME